jgi:hypothetical protein
MKLTKVMKETVVEELIKKAFSKKMESFIEERVSLYKEVVEKHLGDHQKQIKNGVEKSLLPLILKKGTLFSIQVDTGERSPKYLDGLHISYTKPNGDRKLLLGNYGHQVNMPDVYSDFHTCNNSCIETKQYKALNTKINKFLKEFNAFKASAEKVSNSICAVVFSCTTDVKLIELIPSAGAFIGPISITNNLVPIETLNTINSAITGAGK